MNFNKENLAWAAGLFDGEGCFCISHKKNKLSGNLRAIICMTEKEPIERFLNIVKIGKIVLDHGEQPEKNCKAVYRWYVHGYEKVQFIIIILWNWLSKFRKLQAIKKLKESKTWLKYQGEKVHFSKLLEVEIIEIKKELLNYKYGLFAKLAKKYNVTDGCIALIHKGHTWKSIKIK